MSARPIQRKNEVQFAQSLIDIAWPLLMTAAGKNKLWLHLSPHLSLESLEDTRHTCRALALAIGSIEKHHGVKVAQPLVGCLARITPDLRKGVATLQNENIRTTSETLRNCGFDSREQALLRPTHGVGFRKR